MAIKKKETSPKTEKKTAVKKAAKKTTKKPVEAQEEVDELILNAGNAKAENAPAQEPENEPKTLGSFKDEAHNVQPTQEPEAEATPEEKAAAASWREYKENESAKEMGDRLQKQADEHKKELENIKDPEKLDKMEEEILATLDEFDKYIKQKRYELPKYVTFDGSTYSKENIGARIARALNKKEVNWQYSLGLYQLHKLWSNIRQFATIPYDAYDSTVRVLGDIQFKGFAEWKDILIINEFFVGPNKEFYKDSTMLIYYSTIHSQIIERKQIITPIKAETTTEVEAD